MRYGYARVSTEDQSLEIQLTELKAAGCEDIRSEKISGYSMKNRPEFSKLLSELKAGDEVWVVRIDRFARSLTDLSVLVDGFNEIGVALKATQQPIDTTSASGKAFLGMLGVFAEFERNITAERRTAGIKAAQAAGKYAKCGRPKKDAYLQQNFGEFLKVAKHKGVDAAAAEFGMSRSSVYRYVAAAKSMGSEAL